MIAIFKPVKNWYWFDIREFDIIKWKYKNGKWLKIAYCSEFIWELIIFKPIKEFKNRNEFNKQFTNIN